MSNWMNCLWFLIQQNTIYYEALCAAWNSPNPSRQSMPSISRLQKLVEAAWAQGFDVQVCTLVEFVGGILDLLTRDD